VVLVEAVLKDVLLFQPPFEVTAGGPVGNIALGEVVADFVYGLDNVLVRNAVRDESLPPVLV
jgi:hypothetical protein